jgi:hypothetical protein
MSDRRSVTPIPNPSARSQPASTISSSPIVPSPSLQSTEQDLQHSSESPKPPLDRTIAGPSTSALVRRASDEIAPQRSAKRMRQDIHSGESEGDGNHSSASEASSQSTTKKDVASPSGPSASPASAPPQKKKRTRTLTTPHQSAVLHALLKQVCDSSC